MTNPRWTYGQSLWETIRKVYAEELAEDPAAGSRLWEKYEAQLKWVPKLLGLVCDLPPPVEHYKMDDVGMLKVLAAFEYMKMEQRDKQNPLRVYMSDPLETDLGMTGERYYLLVKDFMPYENSTFETGLLKYYWAMKKANEEPIPEYYEEPF